MLLLFIIFVICMISMSDDDAPIIFPFIISLIFTGIFIGINIDSKNDDIKRDKSSRVLNKKFISTEIEHIYSLGNGASDISGSFFLGSGSYNSEPQYSYFIKNKNGSKEKKHIQTSGTEIFEGENEPKVIVKRCKTGIKFNALLGWHQDIKEETCDFTIKREIHVPKNTVILNFKI